MEKVRGVSRPLPSAHYQMLPSAKLDNHPTTTQQDRCCWSRNHSSILPGDDMSVFTQQGQEESVEPKPTALAEVHVSTEEAGWAAQPEHHQHPALLSSLFNLSHSVICREMLLALCAPSQTPVLPKCGTAVAAHTVLGTFLST